MKLISFGCFKKYCNQDSHHIGRAHCDHPKHETTKNFVAYGEKYTGHPCMEKHCPVFKLLKI